MGLVGVNKILKGVGVIFSRIKVIVGVYKDI